MVSAALSTTVLLPNDRTEAVASLTLKAAKLESSHRVVRVDTAGHPLVVDSVKTVGVGFSRAITHSLAVSDRGKTVHKKCHFEITN